MSISKVNDMYICKEVRCCCIYDNQTFKLSIFCSYDLHWITRRLFPVPHPSVAGCSKCLSSCTFKIWEIWHFFVKVSNTTTNFVVKRLRYWIAFCRCSRAIWIASERKENWMHRVSYGPWTPTKCDSMLNTTSFIVNSHGMRILVRFFLSCRFTKNTKQDVC